MYIELMFMYVKFPYMEFVTMNLVHDMSNPKGCG